MASHWMLSYRRKQIYDELMFQEPKKHWFVLSGDSLRYFKDSRAEDSNQLEGRIDLSTCYDISEVPSIKNYGFSVKVQSLHLIINHSRYDYGVESIMPQSKQKQHI